MDISKISPVKSPIDINVLIEIFKGQDPVKYELDKDSGVLYVDRSLTTCTILEYGFIPNTLSDDGIRGCSGRRKCSWQSGCVIRCRPVGALVMEDEAGMDEKIIAVPVDELFPIILV